MRGSSGRAAGVAASAALGLLGLCAQSYAQEPATDALPVELAPAGDAAPSESDDPFAMPEPTPIDPATRAAERQAGLIGLSVWTIFGIAGGAWLVLRWRRKPPAPSAPPT